MSLNDTRLILLLSIVKMDFVKESTFDSIISGCSIDG
jgi:hypothetical protein